MIARSASLALGGTKPGYSTVIDMETLVSSANADRGRRSLVTTSKVRGLLKKAPKVLPGEQSEPGYPIFTWEKATNPDADGSVNRVAAQY